MKLGVSISSRATTSLFCLTRSCVDMIRGHAIDYTLSTIMFRGFDSYFISDEIKGQSRKKVIKLIRRLCCEKLVNFPKFH